MHDTEDRAYWFKHGLEKEYQFVSQIAPQLKIDLEINSSKKENPKAIDFVYRNEKGKTFFADLKTQNTPFFTAGRKGKDPGETVTFNLKDLEYYERVYPDAVIFFHVHWTQLTATFGGKSHTVEPKNGVWKTTVSEIRSIIDSDPSQHDYLRRVDDNQGNAKSSYLLSLNQMTLVGLLENA